MCMWVRAMHKYHQVSVMVEPKKKLLAEATAELEETMQKLVRLAASRLVIARRRGSFLCRV